MLLQTDLFMYGKVVDEAFANMNDFCNAKQYIKKMLFTVLWH